MSIESELKTQKEMTMALASVMRCLIGELEQKGLVDVGALVEIVQRVALVHREKGEETQATLMFRLSEYILKIPNRGPKA
jgi:hypothetical protein